MVNTYRKEEVRDIVGDIDANAQISKMESVAEADKSQGNDVVAHELLEVLSRLLQLQQQHNCLLGPVTCLQQVKRLEVRLMLPVREAFKHGSRVKVPNIGPAHHVKTKRTKNAKVKPCVHLFHESCRLAFTADTTVDGERPNKALHQEFTSERQNNRIERHKCDILGALSVHSRTTRGLGGLGIGEENGAMHRVGRRRVDQVQ